MAGGPWPQVIARAQRRHEPAKLPRPQRIRARAIRARTFQLHVAVSNATVSSPPRLILQIQTFVCLGHDLIHHGFHVLSAFPHH